MGAPTDPIADMLTAIRNALQVRHPKVDVPASRIKSEIARVLKEEGFVAAYKVIEENNKKILRLYLKYGPQKQGVITGLRRLSTPGRRAYRRRKEIKAVYGGLGISILTTPQGIMTGRQARRQGVGGEILCEVW
uniref:Small ribosomal subunit protein uS8 n=1 Tax=uncultured Acidobacteria bacterium Rifle_16ft_4_minimus_23617 TaxID=1665082 RepID=A0A0H4T201_9BACT|nr:30S ribosomal protein S8, small subunit ribosomal protein S8 [uncultured Acidobacteria bacterium Rifle_16ft_4_minimus_23617]